MMKDLQTIQFDLRQGVARIVLNRPEKGNAVNLVLATELLSVANRCAADPGVRAVLLTGAGRFFCVGGDLNHLSAVKDRIAVELRDMTSVLHAAIGRLTRMDAPIVVSLNGSAGGGGMGLALLGDLVVAAEHARLKFAYPRLGYSADAATTYLLPRLVGLRKAQEIIFRNREIEAREAQSLGLVTYVASTAQYAQLAEDLARELAQGPSRAFGMVKRLLAESFNTGLEAQMEMEATSLVTAATSPEGIEGLDSFVNKRKPLFCVTD